MQTLKANINSTGQLVQLLEYQLSQEMKLSQLNDTGEELLTMQTQLKLKAGYSLTTSPSTQLTTPCVCVKQG